MNDAMFDDKNVQCMQSTRDVLFYTSGTMSKVEGGEMSSAHHKPFGSLRDRLCGFSRS